VSRRSKQKRNEVQALLRFLLHTIPHITSYLNDGILLCQFVKSTTKAPTIYQHAADRMASPFQSNRPISPGLAVEYLQKYRWLDPFSSWRIDTP
jgi:hypothetical protein